MANLAWLFVKIMSWWGYFTQIGTHGVGLNVSLSEINFAMAGYLLCIDLILA